MGEWKKGFRALPQTIRAKLDRIVAPHGDQPAVEKGGPGDQRGRLIGRTKGGMNTKLHAICDSQGRPLSLFVTAGQVRWSGCRPP